MRKRLVVLAVLLLPLASAHLNGNGGSAERKASLYLKAIPRVGEIPAEIQFYGSVRGGRDNDPELYCLEAEWDFEGVKFTDREDCPPPEGDFKIRRTYSTLYTFEREGSYQVQLSLKLDGRTVLTRKVEVQARRSQLKAKPGSGPQPSGQ